MTSGAEFDGLASATGPRVLEQAVTYLAGGVRLVTPELMDRPTPCAGWDLRMLLSHVCESLEALTEAIGCGEAGLWPAPAVAAGTEIATARARCGRLLAACAVAAAGQRVAIAGRGLSSGVVMCAGAVEAAVHGWDVRCAAGRPCPVPPVLAETLLRVVPVLVAGTRDGLFAEPVPVPASASPGDRLIAFLGRPVTPLPPPPPPPRTPGAGRAYVVSVAIAAETTYRPGYPGGAVTQTAAVLVNESARAVASGCQRAYALG